MLTAHNKLKRREEEIRVLSLTNQLTGIANRRRFDEAIAAEYARVRRYGGKFALMMADIDHFKSVNDEYGHDVGDAAIRTFAPGHPGADPHKRTWSHGLAARSSSY